MVSAAGKHARGFRRYDHSRGNLDRTAQSPCLGLPHRIRGRKVRDSGVVVLPLGYC